MGADQAIPERAGNSQATTHQKKTLVIDLCGVLIPAVTPFLPGTGEIDLPAMQENLRAWSQFPIRGVVLAGTTGEAVLVDEEERLESTRATLRLTRAVAEAGAEAVLVQPPALDLLSYRGGDPRPPIRPLSGQGKEQVREILVRNGLLDG